MTLDEVDDLLKENDFERGADRRRNREVGGGIFHGYSTAPMTDGKGDRPAK
jgi:hypothetical protein